MSQPADTIRARYGMIIPSSNRMAEPHAFRYAPPGVVAHTTRLRMTGPYFMPLDKLLPQVATAAETLADANCDPIVFHCTANSMAEGVAGEKRIAETIEQATGRRATTTAAATLAALGALGARRIVLVSPYVRATHEHEIEFLTEAGFEIVGEKNLGLTGAGAYSNVTPESWVETLDGLRNDRAEAYFVSCANVRAIESLERMESLLDRPVVTSNQVVIWQALRLAGLGDAVPGLGRLAGCELAAAA